LFFDFRALSYTWTRLAFTRLFCDRQKPTNNPTYSTNPKPGYLPQDFAAHGMASSRQVRRVYCSFPFLTPSYIIWMAQRMMAVYKGMSSDEQQRVYDWVSSLGGAARFDLVLRHMRREGVKAVRAN